MKCSGCVFAIVLFVLFTGVSLSGVAAAQNEKQPAIQEEEQPAVQKEEMDIDAIFEEKETEEEYYRTDRVLMTATKHLMDARKAPAINTVITGNEIRNMGARNIMDVLRKVPSIGISQSPGTTQKRVEVRGVRTNFSEKVLLLIDGHRMNDHINGTFGWVCGDLMVDNIKRIEIVRGPGSALYGANAFIAVINVITKTAEDIGGQQFLVTGGSFSTQQYNGLFSHKGDRFQISGHVNYFDTDGATSLIEQDALTGGPGGLAPGDTLEFREKWDAEIRMKYGDLSFRGRVINTEYGPFVGALRALNDETVFKFTHIIGDLIYKKSLTEDIGITVKLYTDYYDADVLYEVFPEGFTGLDDKGFLTNPRYKNRILGGEITTDYALGDHFIIAGVNYEFVKQYDVEVSENTFDFFSDPVDTTDFNNWNKNVDRTIWAVYLQNMWEITSYDSLTLGVRYDNYDDIGDTINPRAGYVHEFKNDLIFKLLYGSAFRAPVFQELYTTNNPAIKGNTEIDPEKIQTYEASLECPFLKNYSLRVSYFHNDIEDLIRVGPKPPDEPAPYINVDGKTQIDGFEAELDFHFAKDRYGYINCAYQNAKDEKDKTLPLVPEWRANAGMNFGLSKYLNANVNVSWIGKRPRVEGDTREDLDSNTLVDLTLVAKNFLKGLEIRGSVYNLFDEDYRDPHEDLRIPNDLPTDTRMFLIEALYKF